MQRSEITSPTPAAGKWLSWGAGQPRGARFRAVAHTPRVSAAEDDQGQPMLRGHLHWLWLYLPPSLSLNPGCHGGLWIVARDGGRGRKAWRARRLRARPPAEGTTPQGRRPWWSTALSCFGPDPGLLCFKSQCRLWLPPRSVRWGRASSHPERQQVSRGSQEPSTGRCAGAMT